MQLVVKDGIQGVCEATIMDFLKTLQTALALWHFQWKGLFFRVSALFERFSIQFHNYLLEYLKSVAEVFRITEVEGVH